MSHFWSSPHEAGYGTPCGRVTAREVIFWLDTGNPHTEYGTSCTHAAFLAGALHEVARSTLGPRALEEMLAVVRGAAEDPAFAAEFHKLRAVRAIVEAIPHDPALPALLAREDRVDGRWIRQEGARSPGGPRAASISFEQQIATVSAPGQAPVPVELAGTLQGFVFASGVWLLDVGGIVAIDVAGRERAPSSLARAPWGSMLRTLDVYAVQDRALAVFDWYHPSDGGLFVCEFRPDEGLVGRCALSARPPSRELPPSWRAPRDRFMD